MAKNRTAEEIADDNERTNAVGLFNYADSYLCCAKHLNASPSLHLRFDAPIHYLLFHAAELYLKSYLRQRGEDLETVKGLGHFHSQICVKAAAFGMNLPAEIREIFEVADRTDAVIESRYLRTGPKQRIDTMALLTAVQEVRAKVKLSYELQELDLPLPKLCLEKYWGEVRLKRFGIGRLTAEADIAVGTHHIQTWTLSSIAVV